MSDVRHSVRFNPVKEVFKETEWLSVDEERTPKPTAFPHINGSAGLASGCRCCNHVELLLQQHQEQILTRLDQLLEAQDVMLRESPCANQSPCASQTRPATTGTVSSTPPRRGSRFTKAEEDEKCRLDALCDGNRDSALAEGVELEVPQDSSCTCRRLLSSRSFDMAVIFAILASAVVLGIDVQLEARDPLKAPPVALEIISLVFSCFFFFEIVVRLQVYGWTFFTSQDRWWNLVDVVLVACSITDLFAVLILLEVWRSGFGEDLHLENYRMMRTLRFARIIRLVRVNRLLRFVTPLRLLVGSIISTLWHLCCALQLFLLTVFFFSVYFARSATQWLLVKRETVGAVTADDPVVKYWKDLPRSMFTLFQCMSAGVSWGEVIDPLMGAGPELVWVFMLFIAFAHLALLNVVTGVFCQVAIESAQRQKDLKVNSIIENKSELAAVIRELFNGLDEDGSGHITFRELKKHCEGSSLMTFMATLDLEPRDLWQLFTLLDADSSDTIDPAEFVNGCMRLRGTAKALELATLQMEHQKLALKVVDFMKYMERRMDYFTGDAGIRSDMLDMRPSSVSSLRSWNEVPRRNLSRTSGDTCRSILTGDM